MGETERSLAAAQAEAQRTADSQAAVQRASHKAREDAQARGVPLPGMHVPCRLFQMVVAPLLGCVR